MKKKQKKFPIWAIISICVAVGLIIAGAVCFTLIKVAEAEDLKKSKEIVREILDTRETVEAYLNSSNDGQKLTDENKEKFEKYESVVEKVSNLLSDLDKRQTVKSGDAEAKYKEVREKLGDFQKVAEIEQLLADVMDDGEINSEEIEQLAKAGSAYLGDLAEDLKSYYAKAAEFNEKYEDLKGKSKTELDADYAKIQQDGNELAKKYAEIKFDDVHGMSRDDILNIYAKIEELNKILTEKN